MNVVHLRKARKAANLTQAQLAKELNVNRATISKYETGEISPSVEQLINICTVLDVSFEELIGEEPGPRPSEVYRSLKLTEYVRSLGYAFFEDYPDPGSGTCLCVDENARKLYLISPEDVLSCEKSLHGYANFQIAELIKNGKEIPDTDGWFEDKK